MRFVRIASVCLVSIGAIVAVSAVPTPDRTNATVVNVIDGDTVVVVRDGGPENAGAEVVRLLNVDAPELDECGWTAATVHLENRLLGTRVRLELDRQTRDRYGRTLAGISLDDELVNADIVSQGLGWPTLVQPNARFYSAVSADWTGPASALTDSCDRTEVQQRTSETALAQNGDRGLDDRTRHAAQAAWQEYEQARSADLAQAVAAIAAAEEPTISTAFDLLDDPRTASARAFDDEDSLQLQVHAAEEQSDYLNERAGELRDSLRHPSTHSTTRMGDEQWVHVPAGARARAEAELRGMTEQAKQAVKDARKALRAYRTFASEARERAAAKARAREAKARAAAKARARAAVLAAQTPSSANGYVRGAAPADAVRVATYNVCKSTCGKGAHSWGHRRTALVNEVRWADPDVLAVQEANTSKWRGVRQIDDVRRLLRPVGYEIASTRLTCSNGCTRGAHIFYKPSRLSLSKLPNSAMASAGMTSLEAIAHKDFGRLQDRAVSWAFLTPRGSTRPTLYVSAHLITEKTKRGEALRVATARGMSSFTRSLIARSGLKGKVPIVVAGDFNSYAKRQPHGAQAIMAASGLRDGYSAPVKVNATVGTVNYTPKIAKHKGFPPRPPRYENNTTRIDYVFSTVAPLRYEVVVRLTSGGRFDERFRASDHNMVMVDLPVR